MNFWNEAKYRFKISSPINRLIYINAAVFLILVVVNLFLWAFKLNKGEIINLLAMPSNLSLLIQKPWTFITYQFTHLGLFHFIFNMMFLYIGGNIFQDYFKRRDVWKVYIWGGVCAGILYLIATNAIPAMNEKGLTTLHGASGAVMAILLAATVYAPNVELRLFGIFSIKLKWFAAFFIVMDLISIPMANSGGHFAHLGGALFGVLFALNQKGQIRFKLFEPVIKMSPKPNKHMKVEVNHSNVKKSNSTNSNSRSKSAPSQDEIDAILDKISKSGYDRLSKEEKDILFNASQD